MVLRRIDRDAIQPGVEGTLATEPRQRPIGLQKCLLGDVHDLAGVADITGDEARNLLLIFNHQQIEGAPIASLHPGYQLLVGTPIRHDPDVPQPVARNPMA